MMKRICLLLLTMQFSVWGGEFYFNASYLYWKVAFSNFNIAEVISSTAPNGERETVRFKHLHFPYASGFKLGAGYSSCSDLDLFVNWTWVRNSPHNVIKPRLNQFVGTPVSIDSFATTEAKAHGQTKLNVIDVELGKLFVQECFAFRPFAGLKTAWLNYSYRINFQNAFDMHMQIPAQDLADRFKDHIWGIGPRLGFTSRWCLGSSCFAFVLNAAGSLIWQDFHPSAGETYTQLNAPHGGTGKQHLDAINTVTELFFGLNYARPYRNALVSVSVGYEVQYWTNQTYGILGFTNQSLGTQGLTANLGIGY